MPFEPEQPAQAAWEHVDQVLAVLALHRDLLCGPGRAALVFEASGDRRAAHLLTGEPPASLSGPAVVALRRMWANYAVGRTVPVVIVDRDAGAWLTLVALPWAARDGDAWCPVCGADARGGSCSAGCPFPLAPPGPG
jgi:hypothetical protein